MSTACRSKRRAPPAGFSMIEVLVTLVVTAIGLLGVALILTLGVREQFVSAVHTQATFVGEAMMDRMRSNRQGVWLGGYDGTYSALTVNAGAPTCAFDVPCAPLARAQRDRGQWSREIATMFPAGGGTVQCTPAAPLPAASLLAMSAPYAGFCDLSLRWSEPGEDGDGLGKNESVSWRFTP